MADSFAEQVEELEHKITTSTYLFRRNDVYFRSVFRPSALGLAVPPELEHLRAVLGWPRLVVEALEERLTITGFRTRDTKDSTNEELSRIWRKNRLGTWSSVAHTEALVQGRSFVCVGPNAKDPKTPIVTVESARYMTVETDPRTGEITAALRLYGISDTDNRPQFAALYLPDETRYYRRGQAGWTPDVAPFVHDLGQVPVFQLTNRMSLSDKDGTSEIEDVIDLVDMACRTLTNLGAATETLSYPQNWVLGATSEDFMTDDGEPLSEYDVRMGRLQLLANDQAKIQQLSAADLNQFVSVISMLAKQLASVTGLPMHYMGATGETNPSSADAIRSGEARHVKRAERRITAYGAVWEQVMELAAEIAGLDLESVEVQWADPATPTIAQQADAVVKLVSTRTADGRSVIPLEFARRKLGYTPDEIEEMSKLEGDDPLARMLALTGSLEGETQQQAPTTTPPQEQ